MLTKFLVVLFFLLLTEVCNEQAPQDGLPEQQEAFHAERGAAPQAQFQREPDARRD